MIDQIKSDLKAVDADGNGKIDSEELKELLKKHNSTFTGALRETGVLWCWVDLQIILISIPLHNLSYLATHHIFQTTK